MIKKALIIEDEFPLRNLLSREMKREGFEVFEAENGIEGYKMAEKVSPDIIFLDIVMPKMNGIESMQKIREKNPYIPIIILTNVGADDKILQKIMEERPSYYIIKGDTKIEDVIKKAKEILKIKD